MDTKACSAAQNCDLDPLKLLHKQCFYKFWYVIFRQETKPCKTLLTLYWKKQKIKVQQAYVRVALCSDVPAPSVRPAEEAADDVWKGIAGKRRASIEMNVTFLRQAPRCYPRFWKRGRSCISSEINQTPSGSIWYSRSEIMRISSVINKGKGNYRKKIRPISGLILWTGRLQVAFFRIFETVKYWKFEI